MKPGLFILGIALVFLAACAPAAKPAPPPTNTVAFKEPSPIPPTQRPTDTSTPLPTDTPISPTDTPLPTDTPTITPMPGTLIFPVESLANTIPWLPMEDENLRAGTNYFVFNVNRPPLNKAKVRQALAAAIDREAITEMAVRYYSIDPKPATSFTPPIILSRDLYNEVGVSFNPDRARELLTEAGYQDVKTFPPLKIIVSSTGETAPGARLNYARAIATMWQEHLGIEVETQAVSGATFRSIREKSPPDIFFMAWAADYYDPDNFLGSLFQTNDEYSEYNYGGFSNKKFDRLVTLAAETKDPLKRLELYIQAERILCEEEAAIIPLFHSMFRFQ